MSPPDASYTSHASRGRKGAIHTSQQRSRYGHSPDKKTPLSRIYDMLSAIRADSTKSTDAPKERIDMIPVQLKDICSNKIPGRVTLSRTGSMPSYTSNIGAKPAAYSATDRVDEYARRPPVNPSTPNLPMLRSMLSRLFRSAINEVFEDGMDSHFSIHLHRFVLSYGVVAVEALKKMLDGADVSVAEEAIRQMGYIEDPDTHQARLSLLEHALESSSVRIRDAASIGIESMDDPAAIESLQTAIQKEPNDQLRQNFQDVLVQLQDVR